MLTERRRARSARRSEALHFLLHRTKEKLGAPAITLGTVSGSLLAGAGDDLPRVAGLGADVNAGREVSEHIATWRLRVGDKDLLLTSVGGIMDPDLGAGVRRIVSECLSTGS
jgi:hypothetical protein